MSFHPELFCKIAELPFNDNGFFSEKKRGARGASRIQHKRFSVKKYIILNLFEIEMVFYVVGNIVFWEFIHREHDDRPYQKALLL